MKTAKIEIFKAGIYGNTPNRVWSEYEVDKLIENYDTGYRSAPIILGHNDWNGEKPAYGWVQKLSKNDRGVVEATIEYNDELEELVKQKKYRNVSIEVVKNIELIDKTGKQGAYLLAVALLGSNQPAVAGLKPVEFRAFEKNVAETFTFEATEEFKCIDGICTNKPINESDNNEQKEDDRINYKTNGKDVDMTLEELQEKFNTLNTKFNELQTNYNSLAEENKTLKQTIQEQNNAIAKYVAEKKQREIEAFIAKNEKKILPSEKESIANFMANLEGEALEQYKSQIEARPDLALFKELSGGENKEVNSNSDEQFELQAKKDLEAIGG